jgi:hypothetical protein
MRREKETYWGGGGGWAGCGGQNNKYLRIMKIARCQKNFQDLPFSQLFDIYREILKLYLKVR